MDGGREGGMDGGRGGESCSIHHMHVRKKMAPAGNECYVFFFDGFYI